MKSSRTIISLIFTFLIVACAPQSAPPTSSAVPATATDSATDLPEPIPSSTPTLALLPTLTPLLPTGDPEAYRLVPQMADQAEQTIAKIEQTIHTLEDGPEPYYIDFLPYYRAIWYATWNALAHFPNDQRAESWRWKMAHYMTLSGEGNEASQTYIELLTSILNADHVSVDDLPKHMLLENTTDSLYSPAFTIEIKPIRVPNSDHGFIARIGNLQRGDSAIAACFLLTEKKGKYTAYFIQRTFDALGYSIMSRESIDCSPKDVTDDGIDEIITDRYAGGHNGAFTFQVFDTTSLPPKVMPFITERTKNDGAIVGYYIEDLPKVNGKTQIPFLYSMGQSDCDNYRTDYFQWTGKSFQLVRQDFSFGLPPDVHLSSDCVEEALDSLYSLNTKQGVVLLEKAVQAYRPYADRVGDIFNELLLHQAIYYALDGRQEKARLTIAEVAQSPIIPDSVWTEPTKKFLETYRQPADLYLACTALISCTPYRDEWSAPDICLFPVCDTESTLSYTLTNLYPSIPLDQVTTRLKKIGVDIAAEGWLDFDLDQKQELWFTLLRPQKDEYRLWFVAESPKGNIIFDAGFYLPNVPQPTLQIEHSASHPLIVSLDSYIKFELLRDPKTDQPSMHWLYPQDLDDQKEAINAELENFKQLRRQLFQNNDPVSIYHQLVEIDQKYSDCPFKKVDTDGYVSYFYNCDAFYYTLAFSAELAGKESDAVKRYYAVWAAYPSSSFATLARLKLAK